jgi:hypothetical protein
MNRTFTSVAVCGLALAAVALCIGQTVEFRGLLDYSTIAILVSAQGVFAGVLIAACFSLLRKHYSRQKKPTGRRPVPVIFEPVRRLFVSVLS